MSWRATLVPQIEHRFRGVSRAIQDLDWEHARFEIATGRPSAAWILGHLILGADSLSESVAGLESGLEPDFRARGQRVHWGVTNSAGWQRLRGEWERTSERARSALEGLSEGDLEKAPAVEILPAFEERLTTRHAFLDGEVFHFAYHLGQLGSLRAAQDLGWT